jgi:peptide/nickel transport system substrate-binding protein
MRRFSAALFLCLAAVVCSACGDSAARPKASYVDKLPAPEEPLVMKDGEVGTYGGRFTVSETNAPATFNPVTATSVYSMDVGGQMFTTLVRLDAVTQQDTPMLAKSWDIAPDGKSVAFHLRRGAKFSDGQPITSADVLFTVQATLNPDVASVTRDMLLVNGEPLRFRTPDPYTFVVECDQPNSNLLASMDGIFVLPQHVLKGNLDNGTFNSAYGTSTSPDALVTSGPWKLKQYVPGERTVLERNPYWFETDKDGTRLPYLDELVFLVVPDAEAADLKFRAGESDAVPSPRLTNYQWYQDHQAEGHFRFYDTGVSLSPNYLFFNLNLRAGKPAVGPVKYRWFNDARFRRAVSKAINRDALINSPVYFGYGVKNWAFSTPGDKVWSLPDVAHDDYDPDGAREMLSSMGIKDRDGDGTAEDADGHPITFVLKLGGAPGDQPNFVREDLAKVGIKATLQFVDFNAASASINSDFQYDASMLGRTVARPGPLEARAFWRSSGRTMWHLGRKGPDSPEQARIDQLLDMMSATTDRQQQLRWWRELHTIANEQAWVIWMPVRKLRAAVREKFGNVKPAALGGGAYLVLWNAEQFFVTPQGRATN